MHTDAELEILNARLDAFAAASEEQHDTLQTLLQEYQKLLASHRQLKSDYEEEKESREKYKKLARAREPNPFILVLVDGDGYFFRERFMRENADGGDSAAHTLSNSIKEILLPRLGEGSEKYRVMVRIYANVASLSRIMSRAGLVGTDVRSLARFTSGFSGSQELFDFVDVGEERDCTTFKVKQMFHLFIDNTQCKHIFFAGCHDVAYHSMLTPYKNRVDRVTLIKSPALMPRFKSLGLQMEELPSVFKCTKMDGGFVAASEKKRSSVPANATVCKFFQKGYCKHGDTCKNSHTLSRPTSTPSSRQESISDLLPKSTPENEGLIPVNKNGERIDTVLPKPSLVCWDIYQRRARALKPCNQLHVIGRCETTDCPFDHGPIEEESVEVMRFLMREYFCPKGSKCRSAKCYNGHICQKDNCTGSKPCKIKRSLHEIEPRVSEWLSPDDQEPEVRQNAGDSSSEVDSLYVLPYI